MYACIVVSTARYMYVAHGIFLSPVYTQFVIWKGVSCHLERSVLPFGKEWPASCNAFAFRERFETLENVCHNVSL